VIPGVTLDDHGKIIEEDEESSTVLEEAGVAKPVQDDKPKKQEEVRSLIGC
jgi:hypothetical protein